ncbi:hypothetical protein HDU84_005594 [Entophlyctis sp. JEL0112]|nr:hypothetical protein HDU84_005594 [Entophlyctis sp. JEL0112]
MSECLAKNTSEACMLLQAVRWRLTDAPKVGVSNLQRGKFPTFEAFNEQKSRNQGISNDLKLTGSRAEFKLGSKLLSSSIETWRSGSLNFVRERVFSSQAASFCGSSNRISVHLVTQASYFWLTYSIRADASGVETQERTDSESTLAVESSDSDSSSGENWRTPVDRLFALKIAQLKSAKEIIIEHKFPCEEHSVKTGDGTQIKLFRIPDGRFGTTRYNSSHTSKSPPPVLLWHGLGHSAAGWVCSPSPLVDDNLAFLLADNNFDVWLVNGRGSDPVAYTNGAWKGEKRPWDFCIDDIGYVDVPSVVDYILQCTKHKSLSYVGFSQGTAAGFTALALSDALNSKVDFVLVYPPLNPVIYQDKRICRFGAMCEAENSQYLFAGTDDNICDLSVGEHHLPDHAQIYYIDNYNHLDLIWGTDAATKVFHRVLSILRKHNFDHVVDEDPKAAGTKKNVSFAFGTRYQPSFLDGSRRDPTEKLSEGSDASGRRNDKESGTKISAQTFPVIDCEYDASSAVSLEGDTQKQ